MILKLSYYSFMIILNFKNAISMYKHDGKTKKYTIINTLKSTSVSSSLPPIQHCCFGFCFVVIADFNKIEKIEQYINTPARSPAGKAP